MSNATHNLCQNNNFGFELKTALFSNLKGLHLDFGHKSALKFWTNSPRWKVLTDFWSHLSPIRSMCINLDPFGPIWTHLDPFGPIWTHLNPDTHLDQMEPFWTHFSKCVKLLLPFFFSDQPDPAGTGGGSNTGNKAKFFFHPKQRQELKECLKVNEAYIKLIWFHELFCIFAHFRKNRLFFSF